MPKIIQPWLCLFVLKFLAERWKRAEEMESKRKLLQVLQVILDKILDYQIAFWQNNICLSEEVAL